MRGVVAAIGLLALALAQASTAAAPAWRPPTSAEVSQPWRSDSPHRYLAISADFDGDGRPDRADLLVQVAGSGAALVVVLGRSPKQRIVLERLDDVALLDTMGVDLVTPGKY